MCFRDGIFLIKLQLTEHYLGKDWKTSNAIKKKSVTKPSSTLITTEKSYRESSGITLLKNKKRKTARLLYIPETF